MKLGAAPETLMWVFNMVVAVVMGAIAVGSILRDPTIAHDICLAAVSGLTGALAGAGAAKTAEKVGQTPTPLPTNGTST